MGQFDNEPIFENALEALLSSQYGWESEILRNPTEKDLLNNWAKILFENNRSVDRLGDYPLTEGEMQQIVEQINALKTPLKLNSFINGKSVSIKRDNPADALHLGKEVSLEIYDKLKIASGKCRYQIAKQPRFTTASPIKGDKRGDIMLLINGMPVIHIELKRSGIPVSQAINQIERYSQGGVFSRGIFSLVQVFIAMNPEDMLYFANPGEGGKFNSNYYFRWGDFDNNPIKEWDKIAQSLLSIPMAHQLIGFYTVADDTDGVFKVMRSYQYYAANAIWDKVKRTKWADKNQYGGYIWHTTGSGKTMTSFKSAQLIATSGCADKVVFLMDRIELGTQSLLEYQGFADDNDSVQSTENTAVLLSKLKDSDYSNTLIVTSIQKMSNIQLVAGENDADVNKIRAKRLVFIIDEAHRSTFGDMLAIIKKTFPAAIFFGFTGTPIDTENQKKMSTTSSVFGDELHRYTIADGIRDKNVLGFDPYKVLTYKDSDLRRVVALEKAKAATVEEALADENKAEVYYKYMNDMPMGEYKDDLDNIVKGIESYIPKSQYETEGHQNAVVDDILGNWVTISHNSQFHAIFATSSIHEAMEYYRLIKSKGSNLKVAALFDPSLENDGTAVFKEDALEELVVDYNNQYNQHFTIPTFAKYKKDVSARLAHKKPYLSINATPEKQIDILIVVNQMLTGFDSKWVNTLYLDKVLEYEELIQAFSRTNRLYGPQKPFGTIKYYRYPHTMEHNIEAAVKLYSGDKPLALFADKLEYNIEKLNSIFVDIKEVFETSGVENFEKLPSESSEKAQFAKLFKAFNDYLEAAKVQGFYWGKSSYPRTSGRRGQIKLLFSETEYLILVMRYKELFEGGSSAGGVDDVPYDVDNYISEINTDRIDMDYMNQRFDKYIKLIRSDEATEEAKAEVLAELHKTFATLTQEEQKFANIFLHDIERGDVYIEEGKSLRDYITTYQTNAKNDQITRFVNYLGISNESLLREMMKLNLDASNINEFGRLEQLENSVNYTSAKANIDSDSERPMPMPRVRIKVREQIRKFILEGGFEI
ncbi:MAG: HsdR family type I site-specific deoxyribonuclease [Rikenellaceae bacterium]